jgi:class 3 adenylate cyclase/tetratricopeptide (TPR) repeat protein
VTERPGAWNAYVPQMAVNWVAQSPDTSWRSVDGALVFVDISGFTSLSERLASRGRIGAEELTGVLDKVFGRMLEIAYVRGGYLLKFGGDALLLFFDGDDHVLQACASVVEMRRALREASKEQTSVGRINLKMSSGVHTGRVDFFLVGDTHRELVVTGPAASAATDMEGAADAGEIVISEAVAAVLPASFVGEAKGAGWLFRKREIAHPPAGRPSEADHPPAGGLALLVPTALREHLGSGSVEPEHRLVTIGFLKFKGVDALLNGAGAESTASELDRLFRHVQYAIDGEGVTYLASDIDADGGKIILATGVPRSQHDDEGRMLRAMRRILDMESRLELRAGVNRGHVFAGNIGTPFRSSYTVMGDTVNLAARLMAAANPGELYAAPSVLGLSSTMFETTALPPFEVKGKSRPVHAFSVGEESGVRPPELTDVLPFRGREAETEMLVGVVNTCSRVGRGGMMTVTGDTGVGKSRLVAEALARCDGMDTLLIQAEPNGSENPYWAFRDPLRRFLEIERGSNDDMARRLAQAVDAMAPDLSWALPLFGTVLHIDIPDNERTATIDGRFRPQQTAEALVGLLSSGYSKPVAMIAEDGQWLDKASTALLEMIGEAARERPWTVLITARTGDAGFTTLGDEVRLGALADSAVREIAIEATQAAPLRPHELDSIVSRSGGNPLFLNEILRVVSETGTTGELPESLDAVVSTEIDTLPALPRRLLRYSSVLGRRFRRQTLQEYLAPEEANLDDATQRELARFIDEDAEGQITFRHSVVHEIAYTSLPYAKRRELHGRAGRVIERQSGPDTDAVAEYLATHFSRSGEYEKAWRYALIAGDKARRVYANTEAAHHYEVALDAARHLEQRDPEAASQMWMRLADVRELTGQMEAAREALSHALREIEAHPERRADILLHRAGIWLNAGNPSQAKRNVSLARRGLSAARGREHEFRLARLDAFESSIHASTGAIAQAERCARSAMRLALEVGEEQALARAYTVLDYCNFINGIDEPRFGPKAIEIYQRLGALERSVVVINNLGAFDFWEGRWDQAVEWYQKAIDTALRSGNVLDSALAKTNIAEVLIGRRNYAEARPLLADARRVFSASKTDEFLPLVGLLEARISLGEGSTEAALAQLSTLVSEQEKKESSWATETRSTLAAAQVAVGNREAAIETIGGIEQTEGSSAATERIRGMAALLVNQPDEARAHFSASALAAREDNDLYGELLALERLETMVERGQDVLDPAEEDRLGELRDRLGVPEPIPPA